MAGPTGSSAKKKVLVIEDDAEIREILADTLMIDGYPVETAGSGPEGMAWLRANPAPGLVLLGLTSTETSMFLSHLGPLGAIPVVVLSMPDDPTVFPGAAEVLAKPFDMELFLNLVARYC